ncbi:MAG: hypothetical protein LH614_08665 [Pyrinomonadaceae bacterium]|nr:hypothetical protein [Pyrinomonadaceae bacterium]
METIDYLDKVNDRESFILFIRELIKDREIARKAEAENAEKYKYGNASDWENQTIEQFLDGAVSWLEASGREDISWKLMAEFLYCGKIYE